MKYQMVDFSTLLAAVDKPSRYINNELNSYHKQPESSKVNFCFAFPDVYEVGFSHLGLKILYSIINKESDATADRVYAPWNDFAEKLREKQLPLFTCEHKIPLYDFDVIGFTLQSELTYTNILMMLDLARIPLFSHQRNENFPLVIAGGPCAANPEPLAPFFDLFFIGEAEEGIVELKNVILKSRDENISREELLKRLQEVEGVYVPRFYDQNRIPPSLIDDRSSGRVKARKFNHFSHSGGYENQLISWQQATHDRYITEIMRGCSRGCRFCFAGFFYRPVRERSVEEIIEHLISEVQENGWEEAALLSLSSSDYSCIKPLMIEVVSRLKDFQTELSLPSLRVDSVDQTIIKLLNNLRQNGITIAPEAGSQRLRDIINKDITEEHIFSLLKLAVDNNWKVLKLYFMIGLPYETLEDIKEIVALIERIAGFERNKLQINITLSPFVPKPHTPFQWSEMLGKDELIERIHMIKSGLKRLKRVKVKYHDVDSSFLECVLNRGDRKVADLIHSAYLKGANFDGWNEHFNFEIWQNAAESLELDLGNYRKGFSPESSLVWEHIDIGVSKEYLRKELEKAEDSIISKDCRQECTACGVCNSQVKPSYTKFNQDSHLVLPHPEQNNQTFFKYRVTYSKIGALAYVSHLDTLRMLHRLLRASQLPIAYTQGYNRHPKIKFGAPLSVGVEGENEMFDFQLEVPIPVEEVLRSLRTKQPLNWEWKTIQQPDLEELPQLYEYVGEKLELIVEERLIDHITCKLTEYNSCQEWLFSRTRKGKEKQSNLKNLIITMEFHSPVLEIAKKLTGASIHDVLESVFGIDREASGGIRIRRLSLLTEIELADNR